MCYLVIFDSKWLCLFCLEQNQFETFVEQIKASDLPKPTQWDLIDLLKTARQHTEHARQIGWIRETA